MDVLLIPSLKHADIYIEEGQSALFEGRPIPKSFNVQFTLEDKPIEDDEEKKISGKKRSRPKVYGKFWTANFYLAISDGGTPTLMNVLVTGMEKHFHPSMEAAGVNRRNGRIILNTGLTRESVERWQLKFVEQYRFQMLELSLWLAISSVTPIHDGNQTYWDFSEKKFSVDEMKEISKSIGKRIRQKVTPDFLKEVAEIYTRAVLRGDNPIEALIQQYNCAHRTASEYATKARTMKFLPPTSPGRVTVEPDKSKPKAKRGNK